MGVFPSLIVVKYMVHEVVTASLRGLETVLVVR